MDLNQRFALLELRRDEGVKTFEAREIATGRPVQVHLFGDSNSPLSLALLAKIDALPDEERRRIIDSGEQNGIPYVITDPLADYPGFREWLAGVAQEKAAEGKHVEKHTEKPTVDKALDAAGAWQFRPPAPPQPTPQAPSVTQTPPEPKPQAPPPDTSALDDQFARLFDTAPIPAGPPEAKPVRLTNTGERTLQMPPSGIQHPPKKVDPQAAVQTPQEPPAVEPPLPPRPASVAPTIRQRPQEGEFTRMFSAIGIQTKQPEPPAPPRAPAPSAPAAAPPAAAPPAAPPPQQGEFTRMFSAQEVQPKPSAAPVVSAPPPLQQGEFTRMFSAQEVQPKRPETPAPAAPPPLKQQGEFTKMFSAQTSPPKPETPAPSAPSAPQPQAKQPGEFTKMLEVQRPTSAPPPQPPPSSFKQNELRPGEFTGFFQSPGVSSPTPNIPLQPPSPPRGAGEFTQVFGRGDIPVPPSPSSPSTLPLPPSAPPPPAPFPPAMSPAGPGGATQAFSVPRPPTPSAPVQNPSGPGEYTRMFSAPAPLTFGQQPEGPAPVQPQVPRTMEPVPLKPKSRLPLILLIAGGVLLIAAVVALIVFRPH